jgi:hypothetical protein
MTTCKTPFYFDLRDDKETTFSGQLLLFLVSVTFPARRLIIYAE